MQSVRANDVRPTLVSLSIKTALTINVNNKKIKITTTKKKARIFDGDEAVKSSVREIMKNRII